VAITAVIAVLSCPELASATALGSDPAAEGRCVNVGRPLRRSLREAWYSTRYVVNAYPAVYMPLARIRHSDRADWSVRHDPELVIEGFGRSGSTFAVDAFELAQPSPVRLAHHTHAAAQVITAVKWGIPTILIVRHPEQVVPSHMARRDIGARPPLVAWIRFHERLLPYRYGFVVTPFEEMTSNLGVAIQRVNKRFGTNFGAFDHNPASQALVFDRIEARNRQRFGIGTPEGERSLARPTPEREARKQTLRSAYEAPVLSSLRVRAERVYRSLVSSTKGA
jgi:hypothetical protein